MNPAALDPKMWMVLPFVVLLVSLAVAPLLCPAWWSKHYSKVAYGLGAVTLLYYILVLGAYGRVLKQAHEYASFIVLIGSLFVVSGGIHIRVKGEATPAVNVLFLLVGAVIANLFGTTGASMLLIRPWIRMNKYRITGYHIIFFIFIVSNVGGCLTPIGDPPLFMGYLYGIPFWWVAEHCLPMWLVGVGGLLGIFYVLDRLDFIRAPRDIRAKETAHEQWRFDGLWNLFFLAIILGAVFVHEPIFLREGLMLVAAIGSYFTTNKQVHEANHFNFHPIQEVVILFAAIFATMIPALDWLQIHAGSVLGAQPGPGLFYWSTGTLSSVLDNLPTYLSFLTASFGSFVDHDVVAQVQVLLNNGGAGIGALAGPHAEQIRNTFEALQHYHADLIRAHSVTTEQIEVCFLLGNATFNKYVLAISVGAVFFGANTYIGNGPNFLVKSIADHQKVHTPSFLGYVLRYTLPYMAPVLILVWFLFFRRWPKKCFALRGKIGKIGRRNG